MKKSQYNIFVNLNKVSVCYNSYMDNYIIMDKKLFEDFSSMSLSEFVIKHEKSYFDLIENGFIIPDDKDELELIRLEHKQAIADEKNLQIMIYPITSVNFYRKIKS